MSPSDAKTTVRTIVASFIAGASAMVMVGLVGPVAAQSGLAVRDAFAATIVADEPAIQPLDVAAIEARLADVERSVDASRQSTADEVARLDRLAGR